MSCSAAITKVFASSLPNQPARALSQLKNIHLLDLHIRNKISPNNLMYPGSVGPRDQTGFQY